MALYVNTNVSSLNAQRKLANSTLALNTSYQRLSSGLRINSAKDDAAGLQIANRLTAQINGLNQGNRNASDGIALLQTIEGALDEQTNMMQRIRTLAVQAANGTNTSKDREALQQEVTSLCEEITRIAQKSTFAGALILDGGGAKTLMRAVPGQQANPPTKFEYYFQVGANANDEITLECGGFQMQHMIKDLSVGKMTINGAVVGDATLCKAGLITKNPAGQTKMSAARFSVSSAEMAQNTLASIDAFIGHIDKNRAAMGALQNYSPELFL